MRRMTTLSFVVMLAGAATGAAPKYGSPKPTPPERGHGLAARDAREGWISLFDGRTSFGWAGGSVSNAGALPDAVTTGAFGDYELRVTAASAGAITVGARKDVIRVPVGTTTRRVDGAGPGPIRLGQGLSVTGISVRPLNLRPALGRRAGAGPAWKIVRHPSLPVERQAKWEELPDAAHAGGDSHRAAGLAAVGGPGAVELAGEYGDFVLQLEVTTRRPLANAGVFFRCVAGQFLNGYEAQVFNACYDGDPARPAQWATGAIDDRQNARRLVSRDGEPFTMTVVAVGPHLATWVNGVQVTDWTDDRKPDDNPRNGRRVKPGPIQLQAHDPDTDVEFRNVRVAPLQ